MRYVIFRDDDTNALTPVECLDRLYRPLLDRGLPVNLATIPAVSRKATMANGEPEGFLLKKKKEGIPPNGPATTGHLLSEEPPLAAQPAHAAHAVVQNKSLSSSHAFPSYSGGGNGSPTEPVCGRDGSLSDTIPIGTNRTLLKYLLDNPGYRIVQHGCHHDYLEFDLDSQSEVVRRLQTGSRLLQEAGFAPPRTFVAPYDKLSRTSLLEVAARFRVLSTGWYELRRLPLSWWPRYGYKKLRKTPHWRVGRTLLLSHPGCLLSCHHTYSTMMGGIIHYLNTQQVTVLVTHWWEYFRGPEPDSDFIDFLHETISYVTTHPDLKVISFDDLVSGDIRLN